MSSIAVIGGGINGLCIALELSSRGWSVELFERANCLQATSAASTKLLHGGLRYLEQGKFWLVAESLTERSRWLTDAPQHAHWLPLLLPLYSDQRRSPWLWRLGLGIYDGLSLGLLPGFSQRLDRDQTLRLVPQLRSDGLLGAWRFWDGQMDEAALGNWILQQVRQAGVVVHEQTPIQSVSSSGELELAGGQCRCFSFVVNATGPWAENLLLRSGFEPKVRMDLVRGSHLLLEGPVLSHGVFVEVPGSQRIAFLLPYQDRLLVGTTEVTQGLDEPIQPSAGELDQLTSLVGFYLPSWPLPSVEELSSLAFAGLRPIVRNGKSASAASREAVLERVGRLLSVFGGKWTSSRALASRVADRLGCII